ncbi:hypothetical protein AMTRI_Chr04g253110 [Amborella trichopoda]
MPNNCSIKSQNPTLSSSTLSLDHILVATPIQAINLFVEMLTNNVQPENYTFPSILKACAMASALKEGRALHCHCIKLKLDSNTFVQPTLVRMYADCGAIESAHKVFNTTMKGRSVVSSNSMITAYVQSSQPNEALALFREMEAHNTPPKNVNVLSVLSACSLLGAVDLGKWVHEFLKKNGLDKFVKVNTALIDMCAKCGSIEDAKMVFEKMSFGDTQAWSAMIVAFAIHGQGEDALALFRKMETERIKPDHITFLGVLYAYTVVWNVLISSFLQNSRTRDALKLFEEMVTEDGPTQITLLATMISELAMHGHGRMALDAFHAMLRSGVKPDEHTHTGVLSACSHAELVDDGHAHFHDLIHGKYKTVPNLHRYGCMVDLIGRAGMLEQAYGTISSMHVKPDATIWRTLLGACRIHGHACLGEKVMDHLADLKAQQAGDYVLLTNIYASKGNWDGVANLRKVMKDDGIQTSPGWSSIEVNGEIYKFVVDDNSHPRSKEIYAMLEEMERQLKYSGYAVNMAAELHDSDLEMREKALLR